MQRSSRLIISAILLLSGHPPIVEAQENKSSVTGSLFGGSCGKSSQGCFMGLFGATMHQINDKSKKCEVSCVLFPILKRGGYECGKCPKSTSPVAPPSTIPAPTPTVSTPSALVAPTSPVPPPIPFPGPTPGFNITMAYDNVPPGDYYIYKDCVARWEKVITSEIPETSTAGMKKVATCEYPTTIDDLYICVMYTNETMAEGVVGLGGYVYRNPVTGIPIVGFIKLKEANIPGAKLRGSLNSICVHEIGHALGIGLLGQCPPKRLDSNTTREYQAISGCNATTTTPTEAGSCIHLLDSCFNDEVMGGYVERTNYISRISVGWLEDIGFSVNYNGSDPSYSSKNLGTNPNGTCSCANTRRQRNVRGTTVLSSSTTDRTEKPHSRRRRELSEKGYNTVMTFGKAYLQQQRMEWHAHRKLHNNAKQLSTNVEFVGDQAVSVLYMEDDVLHSIIVQHFD